MELAKKEVLSTPPRGVIKSRDIAITLQQKLGLEGRIFIKQVRGGKIEFSINSRDEKKLLDFFAQVPSYRENLYLKEKRSEGKFRVVVTESFFRLRLLSYLYLKGQEQAQTNSLVDLIDKLTGVTAEYSKIEDFRLAVESFEWDSKLFRMLDEESLLCSHVRKLVQAHTIVTMDQQQQRFKPKAAKVIPVDESKTSLDEELDFVLGVIPEDCLTAAKKLYDAGHSVCVLNMANQIHPGGGYANGAGAQEEDLCRRTDLLKSLPGRYADKEHGFGEFNVLYSAGVTVFRGSQAEGYAPYEQNQCFKVNVVSSAAYNLKNENTPTYKNPDSPEYAEGMKRKIRGQLRAAAQHGDRALVLSAFGCGAFRNDAKRVSQFYLEVLSEKEFKGVFDVVQFAIVPNPSETNNNNFDTFKATMEGKGLSSENLHVSQIRY